MSTMRAHLRDMHEKMAAHHLAAAKQHKQLAKCFGAMEKAAAVESAADVADAHEGLAQEHIAMGEFHAECCATLDLMGKAAGMHGGDDDGWPTGLSSIIGDAPASVRPVYRTGQPEFQKLADGMDPQLAKVIGISED